MSTPSRLSAWPARMSLLMLSGSVLLPGAGISAQNAPQQEIFTLSGSLELGAEYNSNISISELETAADESDVAGMLDGALNLEWQPSEQLRAEAGYSYSARHYQDADDFDLDMHLLFGDISYEFEPVTLGTSYYYADADLGGDSFLTLGQYSFYAGKLIGNQLYLRGALNVADKDFDQFTERNADNQGFSVDAFWFFNEGRSNLMLGYTHEDEDTRGRAFAYDAGSLRVRYTHRLTLRQKDARVQLGYRLQDRDYAYITPAIGERRDDRQRVADAELEVSMTQHIALIGRVELGEFESNLESADYSDNRASLSVKVSF